MILKLAGDPIFAKFCHDALQLMLRHQQMCILQFCTGGVRNYVKNTLLNYADLRYFFTLIYVKLHQFTLNYVRVR